MFFPARHFDSVFDITPVFLGACGIKALVLDIDNTLVTYQTEKPTSEVIDWIGGMRRAGIGITIASNNKRPRVEKFCDGLDVFFTWKSAKPLPRCVRLSEKKFGIKRNEVAVVGDQIFTDVLCAKFSGATAFLVTPLKSPESAFIRFKRVLEKPIIKAYKKKHQSEFGEEKP